MNFFPHHISTPSRPSNIDFPKIVDFTNKEISWKWCSNSEMIEKTWLLQESITHPTTGFEVFVNKKPTFNCSINDAGTTIFLRCWVQKKKSANIVLTVFEQNFAFENFGLHFWKKIDWQSNWLGKMLEEEQKTANAVPTVFEQKFAFESFGLHFWENNCLTSNNNDQIDLKRCWVKNENSKYCAHCLRTKVRF